MAFVSYYASKKNKNANPHAYVASALLPGPSSCPLDRFLSKQGIPGSVMWGAQPVGSLPPKSHGGPTVSLLLAFCLMDAQVIHFKTTFFSI